MIGKPCFLANAAMGFRGKDDPIRFPQVTVSMAGPVRFGNGFPELAAGFLAPVAECVGDDLARPATQGNPQPTLILAALDERPHFVQLQDVRGLRVRQRWREVGFGQRRVLEPLGQGGAADAKNPTNPTHARALEIGRQYSFFFCFGIPFARIEHTGAPTGFAAKLLLPANGVAILHQVATVTIGAGMDGGFRNHCKRLTESFN